MRRERLETSADVGGLWRGCGVSETNVFFFYGWVFVWTRCVRDEAYSSAAMTIDAEGVCARVLGVGGGTAGSPGDRLMTEPGDAAAATTPRRPTYGGRRDFSEQIDRSGRWVGTKAQWAHAAHKRCVDDRDRLCRREDMLEKIRRPRSGLEGVDYCEGVGG